MSRALRPPVSPALADQDAERVRRGHDDRIRELQRLPMAGARVIRDVSLANGVVTPIAHGLGRAFVFVSASCPRGASSAGVITEYRTADYDRGQVVALHASGFGATITVDVLVM